MPNDQYDVFLSYARADDDNNDGYTNYDYPEKSFIRRLYKSLIEAKLRVWWDRKSLHSDGRDFTKEIEDAIRISKRFLLVMGPEAVKSEYVTAEWQFANKICKPITPILRAGEYDIIPEVLSGINAIDIRPTREESIAINDLINHLREDAIIGNPLGFKKTLPPEYILREESYDAAHQALCTDEIQPTAISVPREVVVLYGLGGIGKSTLATALGHDCDIRRHFKDGIVWIDVGQNPVIIELQEDIGVKLGDDRQNYQKVSQASRSLHYVLQNKAALIILDDVWDHKLIENFPINGTACRLLITTRSSSVAEHMQGIEVRLNVLGPEEGEKLIQGIIGTENRNPMYRAINERFGGHTLAVSLAAKQIKNNYADDPADLLRLIDKRKSGTNPFKDLVLEDTDKDLNLTLSLSLSYEALPDDDLRRRFRQVGIFPAESSFDREALASIWGDQDSDNARQPIRILQGAGLLDVKDDRYTQHGLLQAYARALIVKEEEETNVFARYARHYTNIAEGFGNVEVHDWANMMGHDLEHIITVGDTFVEKQDNPVFSSLALKFALATASFVHYRPEYDKYSWLKMGQILNNKVQSSDTLYNEQRLMTAMSYFLDNQRQYDESFEYRKRVFEICNELNEKKFLAPAHKNLGRSYLIKKAPKEAWEHLQKSLSLFRELNDIGGEGVVLIELGDLYKQLGETNKALNHYEQALKCLRMTNYKTREPEILNRIGSIYSEKQNLQLALGYYQQALSLYHKMSDRDGEAITYYNISTIYQSLEDLDSAIEYLEKCVVLEEKIQHPDLEDDRRTLEKLKQQHNRG